MIKWVFVKRSDDAVECDKDGVELARGLRTELSRVAGKTYIMWRYVMFETLNRLITLITIGTRRTKLLFLANP